MSPAAFPASAQDSGTNKVSAMLPPPTLELSDSTNVVTWQGKFAQELNKNENVAFDRLGPPAGYELTSLSQTLKYGIHKEIASRGVGAFERMLQDSAQETALMIFPVDEWMTILPLDKWQAVAEHLLQGSIGNTAEQERRDLPLTYSATETSWRNAEKDGNLRYGIRPRTAPYAYLASDIGHFENRPLLSLEARARYMPFDRIQTSFEATAPLPYSFELSFSALCEPLKMSRTAGAAVRLQRVVGTGVSACAVFVGASCTFHGTGLFLGLSRPW